MPAASREDDDEIFGLEKDYVFIKKIVIFL